MTTELATRGNVSNNVEQVLLGGDLSKLTTDERLNYYNAVCSSLGLNPLTKPFAYINLNGKLTLYALKDCTEQLRKIHGVSITNVDPKQIGDLLVVVASAADREGRVDSSTGAVNVKAMQGENLANAMMKCETKAKRRVTLSICGLGMLDETEVDTLKDQGVAQEPAGNKWEAPNPTQPLPTAGMKTETMNPSTTSVGATINGEPDIKPRSQKGAQTTTPPAATAPASNAPQGEVLQAEASITPPQGKRLFAIARSAGLSDDEVKARLASIGYHGHRDEMPKSIYEAAIDAIDPQMKFHTNKPRG